jgi:hypothetical protein
LCKKQGGQLRDILSKVTVSFTLSGIAWGKLAVITFSSRNWMLSQDDITSTK